MLLCFVINIYFISVGRNIIEISKNYKYENKTETTNSTKIKESYYNFVMILNKKYVKHDIGTEQFKVFHITPRIYNIENNLNNNQIIIRTNNITKDIPSIKLCRYEGTITNCKKYKNIKVEKTKMTYNNEVIIEVSDDIYNEIKEEEVIRSEERRVGKKCVSK